MKERITELESYLADGGGEDEGTKKSLGFYLNELKKHVEQPHKSCRLVSSTNAATIPFVPIMQD
ncbi:MAG TPA: hypothetical protein VNU92_06535 [Edaphobacter sp.]|jgi:hypothetical protein|nr:hypothetical protein [Edaphobacter sp.]